jgi:chaperone BCS1
VASIAHRNNQVCVPLFLSSSRSYNLNLFSSLASDTQARGLYHWPVSSAMDISRLQALVVDLSTSNSTLSSLPSALMEATLPGYGIISQLIFRLFGIDIGLVVSGSLVIFALFQGGLFLYRRGYDYFLEYFTSSIEIEDDDDLYKQILGWVAEQRMTKISRTLRAVSQYANNNDDEDQETDPDDEDVLDDKGIFNFEKWASNIPPRYEPNYGSDRFTFNGRTFYFLRQKLENKRNMYSNGFDQCLVVRCTGRSTQPIKDLLVHVKSWTLSRENKMTSVYRPAPKEHYDSGNWLRQSCRPSRPIDTVSLDKEQKAKIIRDINEYLHPATARWYAARGIPYRRGYLFHGPPGTGKTSLSFALAGIFGVGVYVISLSEIGLTESDLSRLFSILPKRCIVLLEDIDSAGLRRDGEHISAKSTDPNSVVSDTDGDSDDDITKVSKPGRELPKAADGVKMKSLISLSGLLNIIDGAASHEGRVLIMSTNYPEDLDAALIRPGRVDLQVQFTLATKDQIRDIFTRMYTNLDDENNEIPTIKPPQPIPDQKVDKVRKSVHDLLMSMSHEPVQNVLSPEEVAQMAQQFADELPEHTFSPAEIQGYLLMKKTDPSGALKEAKRKGKKVVSAQ